jgi:RHS repeat-associated protein
VRYVKGAPSFAQNTRKRPVCPHVSNAGNRTSKTDLYEGVTTNYGYDLIYELLNATQGGSATESYTYDPVGNRLSNLTSSGWSYNVSNELNSRPSNSYTYDANGNTQTMANSSGTTTYTWDFENRLTSVALPGSGGSVNFKYDPFGRRIYKSSSSGTSIYAYDGDNLIEEANATGAAVARYSPGLNIDESLAMLRSGTTSYYEADGLGSVTTLSNAAGALANNYTYDSFGNLVASAGSLVNSFHYAGREFDIETNLYYYRARYYDAIVGRFLSEDPLEFDGDGPNFYSYVRNDPIILTDLFGLSSLVFDANNGTLTVIDGNGNVVGVYPAANNAQNGSRGPWSPGTYDFDYPVTHPDDGPDSAFGSNGNFVFKVPGCTGCGVHSGRANVPDKRGRKGPQHATSGCIRTTDTATRTIQQLFSNGDPLTTLTVK